MSYDKLSDKEYIERKRLCDIIKTLVKSEFEEIFRILKKYDQPVTENSNGIFFDMTNITTETVIAIQQYIQFCTQNKIDHEQRILALQSIHVSV